jgi:dGTPase
LEEKYAEFDGLNLTWGTLEGIAKHNGPLLNPALAARELDAQFDLEMHTHASLEAQLASLADDIAYCNHDVDDGIRAGLFTLAEISELDLLGKYYREVKAKYPNLANERLTHEVLRRVFSEMVQDVLENTKARIAEFGVQTVDDVRGLGQMTAEFSPQMLAQIKQVKAWLMKRMYRHPRVNVMTAKARDVVIDLFKHYSTHPEKLPKAWQAKIAGEGIDRIVADYIAGMTDRFALEEFGKI